MVRRNPNDPEQQRTAYHELAHARLDDHGGIVVVRVVHNGTTGWTTHEAQDHQWREYAIACVAGQVGEWAWEKWNNGWFGSRSSSRIDMENFKKAVAGRRLTEGQARHEAKKIILRSRDWFERLAPRLIMEGELSGKDLRR
jgi:hypothetical protein